MRDCVRSCTWNHMQDELNVLSRNVLVRKPAMTLVFDLPLSGGVVVCLGQDKRRNLTIRVLPRCATAFCNLDRIWIRARGLPVRVSARGFQKRVHEERCVSMNFLSTHWRETESLFAPSTLQSLMVCSSPKRLLALRVNECGRSEERKV